MSANDLVSAVAKLKAENDANEAFAKEAESLYSKSGSLINAEDFPKIMISSAIDPSSVYAQQAVTYTITTSTPGTPFTYPKLKVVSDGLEEKRLRDKSLQMKLFVHFAKLFIERYPKWTLVPEPDDPLHKVKLVNAERGIAISSCWPDNTVAIYGAPEEWRQKVANDLFEPRGNLPVTTMVTQDFYGWALDINTPEWVGA